MEGQRKTCCEAMPTRRYHVHPAYHCSAMGATLRQISERGAIPRPRSRWHHPQSCSTACDLKALSPLGTTIAASAASNRRRAANRSSCTSRHGLEAPVAPSRSKLCLSRSRSAPRAREQGTSSSFSLVGQRSLPSGKVARNGVRLPCLSSQLSCSSTQWCPSCGEPLCGWQPSTPLPRRLRSSPTLWTSRQPTTDLGAHQRAPCTSSHSQADGPAPCWRSSSFVTSPSSRSFGKSSGQRSQSMSLPSSCWLHLSGAERLERSEASPSFEPTCCGSQPWPRCAAVRRFRGVRAA